MSRITKKELLGKVRRAAHALGVKAKSEVRYNPRARKYKYSHDHLELEMAYGQYSLSLVKRTGRDKVLWGFISARDMFFLLSGIEKHGDATHFLKEK